VELVFFGTPAFALPALTALTGEHRIKAVVTRADRPRGRGLEPRPSPVKSWALENNVPVLQPERLKDPLFLEALSELEPDAIVVAAYGKIIPPEILELPPYGCINIHGSLLPNYRGAAPIQRAIMNGAESTGVTIMQMDAGMDTGDMLKQVEVAIGPEDDSGSLSEKMAAAAVEPLLQTMRELAAGDARPIKQNEAEATYAPPIVREESEIDWSKPAAEIARKIRGLTPAPGAHTHWRGRRLKVKRARPVQATAAPGIVAVDGDRFLVGAGGGCLEIAEVQPEGKKSMSGAEFVRGYRPRAGDAVGAVRDQRP
jgi:methionyl-tRNA formyltransferase